MEPDESLKMFANSSTKIANVKSEVNFVFKSCSFLDKVSSKYTVR